MNSKHKKLLDGFKGLNDRQSYKYQLEHWVDGIPLHNPVRDECCPDFSCCRAGSMMDARVRKIFADAVESGDEDTKMKILGMALTGLTSEMDNVYIAGEDHSEH